MVDLKTFIHETSIDLKTLQLKICLRNKQKTPVSSHEFFSGFHQTYWKIRFLNCGWKSFDTRRVEETSGRRITYWTTRLDKNAGQEQYILVSRDAEGPWRKTFEMHSMHGLRKNLKY